MILRAHCLVLGALFLDSKAAVNRSHAATSWSLAAISRSLAAICVPCG